MIFIELNNNLGNLSGNNKQIRELADSLSVRNPNAFYIRRYMPPGWDGYQQYIKDSGNFSTGLLPQIVDYIKAKKWEYKIIDKRITSKYNRKVSKDLNGIPYRDNQYETLVSIFNNKVGGILFTRGIIKAATNAGKTNIIAGVYDTCKLKSIAIINNKDLYEQMVREDMPKLLPGKFGYMQGKNLLWGDLMICMAQTLIQRLKDPRVSKKLLEYEVVLVDEGDLSDNKTMKTILKALYQTHIRLCFSGSVLVSKLAKYKIKNQNIKSYYGDLISSITNKELIELGISNEVKIIINKGNTRFREKHGGFDEAYMLNIVKGKERNNKVLKRVKYHLSNGRTNILITVKLHKHVKILYKLLSENIDGANIEWVHHSRSNRADIIRKFKEGKVDILISSLIVKRGLNFPLMKAMINASGGLSPENALQLLGRATRKHESKKYTYYEDFYDYGPYLERHSKRRILTYSNEGLAIIKLYKLAR